MGRGKFVHLMLEQLPLQSTFLCIVKLEKYNVQTFWPSMGINWPSRIIQLQIIISLEKKETKQKQYKCNGFTKSAYEWLVKINFIFIQSFARGTLSHWSLIFDLSKVCNVSLCLMQKK